MLNIANCVNTWLTSQITGLPTIYNDIFPVETGDLIISRHDPSQSASREFGDGTRMVDAALAYYARCSKAEDARKWLEEILNKLDNQQLIRAADNVSFQAEGVSLPQFVEVDDKGQSIYMMAVIISYVDGLTRP